jgi:hypothetical protein
VVRPPRERAYGLVDTLLFACPGAVLVRSYNGGVDHGVFVVGFIRQRFEKTLPNRFRRPARETRVNVLPGTEPRWHVAPRNARPKFPNYRLDEQAIASIAGAPDVSRTTRQQLFYPCELVVSQSVAIHLEASERRLSMNHAFTDSRICWTERITSHNNQDKYRFG